MVSWQFRKLYKALRYTPKNIKRYGHVVIDKFLFNGDVLSIVGWSWDRCHSTNKRYIEFRTKSDDFVHAIEIEGRPRYDLPSEISIPPRAFPGFDIKVCISSSESLDVFLCHETNEERLKCLIGSISLIDSDTKGIHISQLEELERRQFEPKEIEDHTVDIIVPIYNGYDYLVPLFESIKKTNVDFRVFLVNDCSSDIRVQELLLEYSQNDERYTILSNETNQGFVASVNRGLMQAENDVVLLNTDVILPAYWLERLMIPIWNSENIASTTPYTNSGTICSFPIFCEDNNLISGLDVQEMDNFFINVNPVYPTIPTGVGFCMGMSHKALKEVGILDEVAFGRGYGEENDWCRRAAALGYLNIHVDNLFVFHNHGGTFPSEEKVALIADHAKELNRRYPDYESLVHNYIFQDPLYNERKDILRRILLGHSSPAVVALDHNLGGGATKYLDSRIEEYLNDGYRFIVVRYLPDIACFRTEIRLGNIFFSFYSLDIESVLENLANCREVWVNETVGYPDTASLLSYLTLYKDEHGCKLVFLLHDYIAICQSYNLLNNEGVFCDLPSHDICNRCFHSIREGEWISSGVQEYRACWGSFLRSCSSIIVFSEASLKLLSRTYPRLDNIILKPHVVEYLKPVEKNDYKGGVFTIGILGAIAYHKGLTVLSDLVKYIDDNDEDVKIKIIGYTDGSSERLKEIETGSYDKTDLTKIVANEGIDLFFIPSIWPETFSYTAAEVVALGYPLVVFDIGAPAERCLDYSKGLVIPLNSSSEEIVSAIKEFMNKLYMN